MSGAEAESSPSEVVVLSPLKGWVVGLEEAPDPVFSGRMLGDGVAIHPLEGDVRAPFAGLVRTFATTRHAVTLLSQQGAEILIHVGVDTVALEGTGFGAEVEEGQQVDAGEPLLTFALDEIAQRATSTVTPIIVTNSEQFEIGWRAAGAVEAGSPLMRLKRIGSALARPEIETDDQVVRRAAEVPLPHGIHARPAARIGECARRFAAQVTIAKGERRGDVRSPVELLSLGVKRGDQIVIEGRGDDASAAVAAVHALILCGMGEEAALAPVLPVAAPAPAEALPKGQIGGVMASPGLGIGPAVRLDVAQIVVAQEGAGPADERLAFINARDAVRIRMRGVAEAGPAGLRNIIQAHIALLDDPALLAATDEGIERGISAGAAWRQAVAAQANMLRSTGDARTIERVDDLIDVERQVLRALAGAPDPGASIAPGSIIVARDLLPSQLVALNPAQLAGVCLERGGPTSHVAILCASFGVPALVAMGGALGTIEDGTLLAIDADAGRLHVAPAAEDAQAFAIRVERQRARRADALAAGQEECRAADGARIEVFANLGSAEDARVAMQCGAEGAGLLRTEFLFLDRDTAPDAEEQRAAYQAIADTMDGRPIIVRLLDIGGDKPARYLPIEREENPALGMRGVRVSLRHRHLLEAQLRGILGVRPAGQCRIMIPMVAGTDEVREVRSTLDRLRAEMGVEHPTELGVMVETPAAAVTADLLSSEADFLSIGSNDLAQYVLAMDRGNAAVAASVDALHPAVLRLIGQTCALAAGNGRWTGLCGGLASDAAAIPILLGLGITELSCVPGFVPEAKAVVRRHSTDRCKAHAARALALTSAAAVRALAREFEEEGGV